MHVVKDLSIGVVFVSSLFTDETLVVCSGNRGRVVQSPIKLTQD